MLTNQTLTMLDGTTKELSDYQGQLLMVVNVASRCGLSPQYETLEALQKKYSSRGFTVLGVPSGTFMQELSHQVQLPVSHQQKSYE